MLLWDFDVEYRNFFGHLEKNSYFKSSRSILTIIPTRFMKELSKKNNTE